MPDPRPGCATGKPGEETAPAMLWFYSAPWETQQSEAQRDAAVSYPNYAAVCRRQMSRLE
jgi:hypothetical protein